MNRDATQLPLGDRDPPNRGSHGWRMRLLRRKLICDEEGVPALPSLRAGGGLGRSEGPTVSEKKGLIPLR